METARKIIFVVGLPTSGKRTQASRLCEEFGYTHISIAEAPNKNV